MLRSSRQSDSAKKDLFLVSFFLIGCHEHDRQKVQKGHKKVTKEKARNVIRIGEMTVFYCFRLLLKHHTMGKEATLNSSHSTSQLICFLCVSPVSSYSATNPLTYFTKCRRLTSTASFQNLNERLTQNVMTASIF